MNSPVLVALNGRTTASLSSFILSSRLRAVMLATHGPSAASTPLLIASAPGWSSRSRLMPCEPLDALKNLTKEVPRQAAFEAREGPSLDGDRQDQPGRRR